MEKKKIKSPPNLKTKNIVLGTEDGNIFQMRRPP